MIGPLPPKPTGSGPDATFQRWVWEAIQRLAPNSIVGGSVNRTTRGHSVAPTASRFGNSTSVGMYRIKSVQSDYVTARSWDGAADGSDDVLIAKEPRIRNSVASETIYGVAHTFTYSIGSDSLNKVRHHVSGPEAQDEILVPPWLSNEVVFAIESETGVLDGEGNKVPLLMLRSAQWAKF